MTLLPLTAARELEVLRRAPALIGYLMEFGLSLEDARALSHNAALLSCACEGNLTPREVLERFSLAEIADLCEEVAS